MKISRGFRIAALAALALTPSLAWGGLISITSVQLETTGSNIASDGTVVFAWDVNGDTTPNPVVNGIVFSATQPGTVAIAGFPAVVNEGSVATPTTITIDHYTGAMAQIMGDYIGTNTNANGTVTISGLTIGQPYRVQFLHHQDVNNDAIRQMEVRFGTGTSGGVVGPGNDSGALTSAIFTADSTSQVFTFDPGSDDRAILNAMVLQQLPVAPLGLSRPAAREVVQRGAGNTGNIAITGSFTGSAPDLIQARAVVMTGAANNGTTTSWMTIANAPTGGTFTGTLSGVAAGGWYQVEVRPVSGGVPGPVSAVHRVGVGDVYLTAGQSNAANRGTPAFSPNEDRFSAMLYSNSAWSIAADPMPGASAHNPSYLGSPWSRLGKMLVDRDNIPVAMVCFAEGGSDVTRWLPANNDLYPRMRTAVQRFPANGFRGILWHQGETNAQTSVATPAAQYQAWLQTVIAQSRVDAGWAVPWYVAEASRIGAGLATEEPIVAGQRAVIFADPLTRAGPVTDNFHQEGKISVDTVHFNEAGLTDHAAQWAEILGGTPPLAPKNGDFESAHNPALADGGIGTVDNAATNSPYVNGWRVLNPANDGAGTGGGYYNPDDTFYAGTADSGANGGVLPGMSGRQLAFLSGSPANTCFLQTRRALLQAGHTYTLTAAIGVRSSASIFGGATIELLAEGNVVATRTVDRAALDALHGGDSAGKFTDIAVTFTTGSIVTNGQALAIRIRKPGGAGTYLDFDNVRLTTASTPFASWQVEHFGSTTAAGSEWTADPDMDSLGNSFEYYLGLDPLTADASTFLEPFEDAGQRWIRYEIPLDPYVDTSALELWYSFDLIAWHSAADDLTGSVVETRAVDRWSLDVSCAEHPRAFFQLRCSPPLL